MGKLVLACTLMIGLGAIAPNADPSKSHRRPMRGMTPQQIATLQTKRTTLALDLSQAQHRQVQSLHLENTGKHIEKMKEMQAKRKNGKPKKPNPEERYTLQLSILDQRISQKKQGEKNIEQGPICL